MTRIYIDIETAATTREDVIARVTADIRPPANYKKEESIKEWWATQGEAAKTEAISRTALTALHGSIIAIGYAVDDLEPHVITGAEPELISTFATMLNNDIETANSDIKNLMSEAFYDSATWIGHNIDGFDLRYIWQRCKILGIKLPFVLPLDRYPRGPFRYDTMTEWAGFGNRVKQRDLELAFGLERNDPLENGGADVHQALQEGRIKDVVTHCKEDIRLVREIYKRMR
jgi:hypothetical protein